MAAIAEPLAPERRIEIRRYRSADREAVRALCAEAAFGDRPVETYGPDRELFADLMTGYYLEREPESTWVAEDEGLLVGYLMGARETRRRRRETLIRVGPAAAARFLLRGGPLRGTFWRAARANLDHLWRRRAPEARSLRPYPAHLHLAVAEAWRGAGVGGLLVSRFLEALREQRIRGVHASVRSDNPAGGRFFERQGFRPVARLPALRSPDEPEATPLRVLYGRAL